MNQRPKIKLELSPAARLTDMISNVMMLTLIAFTAYAYYTLPDIIPSHFDATGRIDAYSGKGFIWLVPGIGSFTFLLFAFLSRYPHTFNYTVKITEENAEFQYTMAVQLMRRLKLTMVLMFWMITLMIFLAVKNVMPRGPGVALTIVTVVLPIIPIIMYFVQMSRHKKQTPDKF